MKPEFTKELTVAMKHVAEILLWLIFFALCTTCNAASPTITSFTGGKVTPHMESRFDFPGYPSSLRTAENMLPAIQGPMRRRPGTMFVATIPAGSDIDPRPDPDPAKIQINTMAELALIGNDGGFPMDGDYQLAANLDATGITFWPIGFDPVFPHVPSTFTGTFDGNYYTISNLTIDDTILAVASAPDTVGLFRLLSSTVTVENLVITNMTITGGPTINFSAGLLAYATAGATITNVHVQGSISGTLLVFAGGLFSESTADLSVCSADVDITSGRSFSSIGGLAYSFGGDAINCYSRGSITSTFGVGGALARTAGLFGWQTAAEQSTENCYSAVVISGTEDTGVPGELAGFVGKTSDVTPDFTSNYWDNDLIATPPGALDDTGTDGDLNGILKSTTTNMQKEATYVDWDFDTIWSISEDSDYPVHQWQVYAEALERFFDVNTNVRLIPFEVSTDDSYILEMGAMYIRFYRDDGL